MKRVLTLGLFLTMSLFVHAQVSQWTTSGANIYYNTGNVGIGNSAPNAKLTVFSTIPLGSSPMNSVQLGVKRALRTTLKVMCG